MPSPASAVGIEPGPVRARGEEPALLEEVPGDEPGVYTLQVGSFQRADEASDMVKRLERSGYRAFLVTVNMPDRGGRWYRVRVGPYETKKEAWTSKVAFEEKVRIPAFVVKKKTEGAARGATNLTQSGRAPKRG
jgi:cell division septation protein DedD